MLYEIYANQMRGVLSRETDLVGATDNSLGLTLQSLQIMCCDRHMTRTAFVDELSAVINQINQHLTAMGETPFAKSRP